MSAQKNNGNGHGNSPKKNNKLTIIIVLVIIVLAFAINRIQKINGEEKLPENTAYEYEDNSRSEQVPEENQTSKSDQDTKKEQASRSDKISKPSPVGNKFDFNSIPEFDGEYYVAINDNIPFFDDSDLTEESYEYYSDLDKLGRCGYCMACVGKDIMPTEKRGDISSVKPTGWVQAKYDIVDGEAIWNRSHLLGYQLTGENANEKNLITGARYFNAEVMTIFENMVADYIKETGNHVLYRVTPVFEGKNLVAKGVLMEAESVEDEGEEILYNVFCYNVQPGIGIDYATGETWLEN